MMFLWLFMLGAFVVALAYFAVLCVSEALGWLRASRQSPEKPTTAVTPVKLLTGELRFATREMGPLFGFGDD